MPCNVSLDSPLLEQQSVRKMLNWVTEGVSESVKLEDLIKIARTVIQSELVDCGCDENELTGLKLSYTVTHPEDESLKKVYLSEWNSPLVEMAAHSTENKPEEGKTPEPKSPISTQLMSTLFTRLDEARTHTDTAHASAGRLMATFRGVNTGSVFYCERRCGTGGDSRGQAKYSVDESGKETYIGCTGVQCITGRPEENIPIM